MWVTLSLRKKELKQEHAYYQLEDLQISRQKRQLDRRKRYEQSLIQTKQKEALSPIKGNYDDKIAELNKERDALNQYLNAVKNLKSSPDNYKLNNNSDKLYIKNNSGNYVGETDAGVTTFYNLNDLYHSDGKYYESEESQIALSLDANNENAVQRYDLAYDLSKYTDVLNKYHINSDLSQFDSSSDISGIESSISTIQNTIQFEISNAHTQRLSEESSVKEIWENELEMLEDEVGDEETRLELEQNDIETQMEYISSELQAIGDAASNEIQQNVIKLT